MFYLVYKITNLVNQKIYIGVHRTCDINDSYMGSGTIIKRAINKYGKHNFKKEILFIFDNEEEMFAKEAELVNEEFVKRKDTYNNSIGGNSGDFKQALQNYQQLMKDPEFYKNWKEKILKVVKNPERNEKASRSLKKFYETHEGSFKGKHHTEKSKQKMREIAQKLNHQKGENNNMYGKRWVSNPVTKEVKKIDKQDLQTYLDNGWINKKNPDSKNLQYQGGKYKKLSPEQKEINKKKRIERQIKILEEKGHQVCYINKQTGVRKYFSEMDKPDLNLWEETWSKFNVEEIKQFLKEKKSWKQIAEYYNITYWSIYSWYRDNKNLFKD